MKKKLLFLTLLNIICLAGSAFAIIGDNGITYQGNLMVGTNAANGLYDFYFRLYDSPTNGVLIATNQTGILSINAGGCGACNGRFTATLNFGAAVFDGQERWLEIQVRTNGNGAFTTLSPRQKLTPTPYAITALHISDSAQLPANVARLTTPNTAQPATATPILSGGVLIGATPVNGGAGYLSPPLVTVDDEFGGGAVVTANISGGSVISFNVVNGGSGYSDQTVLLIAPPAANGFQIFSGSNFFSGVNTLSNLNNQIAGIFTGNGGGLTTLNANSLQTGLVPDARLGANIPRLNSSADFSATVSASSFIGSGAGISNLNAANIASGTVPDARLGANIVRSNQAWLLNGNAGTSAGTDFLGTTDNQSIEIKVNNQRALRIEPNNSGMPNLIGGCPQNFVGPGVVGSTIGGGGTTAFVNSVSGDFGVVGGGYSNQIKMASWNGFVGGGWGNVIGTNSALSIIGGGKQNQILDNSLYATIPGGVFNLAASKSFAAGFAAQATNNGSFVWSDGSGVTTGSDTNNTVTFRASGGFRIFTGTFSSGAQLAPGATAWSVLSDRNSKKDIKPTDCQLILSKLSAVPVTQWHYDWEKESDTPHIGPMAQDFKAAFYPGRDDKSISTLEFDGVTLAAIQGLNAIVKNQQCALSEKEARIAILEKKIAKMEATERKTMAQWADRLERIERVLNHDPRADERNLKVSKRLSDDQVE